MWLMAVMVFLYGSFASLQYTAMNTLVCHDLDIKHASMAPSMACAAQYLSMSFCITPRRC